MPTSPSPDEPGGLTHLDPQGRAKMVDVSGKGPTLRVARAQAVVSVSKKVAETLKANELPKGDALTVARIAGIMAAKKTSDLIPLCHPLPLTNVSLDISIDEEQVNIVTEARTTDRTGVEMEALVAASVAALTIYDMCKSMDKSIVISSVYLLSKAGGRSGSWQRPGQQ